MSAQTPRVRLTTALALGTALAYGAGFWLVVLHRATGAHERSEPGLLLHALRDGTLALPAIVAAVWLGGAAALSLIDRARQLPDPWRAALLATGAALAAAVVLAAGNPIHGLLFDAHEPTGISPALHLGRDFLFALSAALPIAAAMLGFAACTRLGRVRADRRFAASTRLGRVRADRLTPGLLRRPPRFASTAQSRPAVERWGGSLTRRGFVAGGLATAGVAGVVLARPPRPAGAQAATDRLQLYINDGHVAVVDGTLVYMRGYGAAPVGDPRPSLTIEPQLFLRDRIGPVASRHYPLVDPSRIPGEGCPADAGIDPSGVALHFIRRRYWASFFPRRSIVAETGSEIRLRITNRLGEPHTFTIDGVVDVTLGPAGSPTATRDVEFAAPGPGTYVYHDREQAPVNRVLGLFGVLVVVPAGAPWTFDGSEGEFERQWVWIFHDIDPEWARRARMGATIDPVATPAVPRYFTLNDRSGVFALAVSPDEAENRRTHEDTAPCGHGRTVDVRDFSDPGIGTGQLIRLVNTGVGVHQPHWHGNHVWTIAVNNQVLSRSTPRISADGHILLQHWEDVVEIDPLQTKAVILPIKPPPDALDVVLANQECDFVFPMHCHAEMSQTAGGGLYPGGAVTDWTFRP